MPAAEPLPLPPLDEPVFGAAMEYILDCCEGINELDAQRVVMAVRQFNPEVYAASRGASTMAGLGPHFRLVLTHCPWVLKPWHTRTLPLHHAPLPCISPSSCYPARHVDSYLADNMLFCRPCHRQGSQRPGHYQRPNKPNKKGEHKRNRNMARSSRLPVPSK